MGKLLNLLERTSSSITRTTGIHLINPVDRCLLSVYCVQVLEVHVVKKTGQGSASEPTVWRGSQLPRMQQAGGQEGFPWEVTTERRVEGEAGSS